MVRIHVGQQIDSHVAQLVEQPFYVFTLVAVTSKECCRLELLHNNTFQGAGRRFESCHRELLLNIKLNTGNWLLVCTFEEIAERDTSAWNIHS